MTPWKITWNILGRSRLREHQLYVKKEKCEFAQQEIRFLGHKVSKGLVKIDERKVQAILDWPPLSKVTKLMSFLGLANYYRKFVRTRNGCGHMHAKKLLRSLKLLCQVSQCCVFPILSCILKSILMLLTKQLVVCWCKKSIQLPMRIGN